MNRTQFYNEIHESIDCVVAEYDKNVDVLLMLCAVFTLSV